MKQDSASEDSIDREDFSRQESIGSGQFMNSNTNPNNESNKTITAGAEMHLTPGRRNLRKWLGKTFRVVITDGRLLVGFFNCTDKDANLVLSMCTEYLEEGKDARILGNVMVPGKHIVSISVDEPTCNDV